MNFVCAGCGYRSVKWMGFCPQCRNQEGLVEESAPVRRRGPVPEPVPLAKIGTHDEHRLRSGLAELDRVLGGGFVPGAVALLGGEPGVGKSTLLLQAAGAVAARGARVLVATAEESVQQVGMRAGRLGVEGDEVYLLAEEDVDGIVAAADRMRPDLLVVDSVQAIAAAELGGAAGGVAQVRESAARLVRFSKEREVATVLVGHVTKDGAIAGPRLLEHMVDVVLYLEGETDRGFRAVRSLKNRFGATHLIGLFEMRGDGMVEVTDPSTAFVADWRGSVAGTVVFPTMEGRRPVLVEVQALVAPTQAPQARRSVRGIETARVHQLLAVLDRHADLSFSGVEVYVGIVGGIRVAEPASDLPVALALASSLLDVPIGPVAAWGEVGLTGELRPAAHDSRRREEAARLGLESVVAAGERGFGRIGEALSAVGLVP